MQLHYYFNVSKLLNAILKIDNIGLCIGDCSVFSQRAVVKADDQKPFKSIPAWRILPFPRKNCFIAEKKYPSTSKT